MPQENGSHFGCDYVTVGDGGRAIAFEGDAPFSFNLSPYTQEELTAKAHAYELTEAEDTILCIDGAHSGVGSNSCGPALMEKYQVNGEKVSLHVVFRPAVQ